MKQLFFLSMIVVFLSVSGGCREKASEASDEVLQEAEDHCKREIERRSNWCFTKNGLITVEDMKKNTPAYQEVKKCHEGQPAAFEKCMKETTRKLKLKNDGS